MSVMQESVVVCEVGGVGVQVGSLARAVSRADLVYRNSPNWEGCIEDGPRQVCVAN